MSENKSILTVVDQLKGIKTHQFIDRIYDPNFWIPIFPLKKKKLIKIDEWNYEYDMEDVFPMDITGTVTYPMRSFGKIQVLEASESEKGYLWVILIESTEPNSKLRVNVRIRELDSGIKVGIYIHEWVLDLGLLGEIGFGKDAVFFAARIKIRESLESFEKIVKR